MTAWLRRFNEHPLFGAIASGVLGAGIGLAVIYACVFVSILLIGEKYSAEDLSIIYTFLAIFLFLGLVDFGVGYRYLVSKWDHSFVVVRLLCSLTIIFIALELISVYFSRNYDLNLDQGLILVVGFCFWAGNISKYLLDRLRMFFMASIVQALPTLMYFFSHILSQDGLFITSHDPWYLTAWIFFLAIILVFVLTVLIVSDRKLERSRSIEHTSLYSEFCFFLILIFGFFVSRFDRFWFSYSGMNNVSSDYFELTEITLRLLVLGGIITRVVIPILAPKKEKIEALSTKDEIIVFCALIVPVMILQVVLVRLYAPLLALNEVIPIVFLLSSVLIVMSFAQLYFTQLVIVGKVPYILIPQICSLLFYTVLLNFTQENLVLLLMVWTMRFYLEAGILRFFSRRLS